MPNVVPDNLQRQLCATVRASLPRLLDGFFEQIVHGSVAGASASDVRKLRFFRNRCSQSAAQIGSELVEHICRHIPQGVAEQTAKENDSAHWALVEDAEIEALLQAKGLVGDVRVVFGTLESRVCGCLNRLSGRQPRDIDHPLSVEHLVRQLQAALGYVQQPASARRLFDISLQQAVSDSLGTYYHALLEVFDQYQVVPLPAAEQLRQPPAQQLHARQANPYSAFHHLRGGMQNDAVRQGSEAHSVEASRAELPRLFSSLREHLANQNWGVDQWVAELEQQGAVLDSQQREDTLLIDELFSSLQNNPRIAVALKPALHSLLPMVMQGVLREPMAFVDPQHPLGSTLNQILQLAQGMEPPNRMLEARVQQLIGSIASCDPLDTAAFDQHKAELDELRALQQRTFRANQERLMQFHRGRDTLQNARQTVTSVLARSFQYRIPEALLAWLESGWHELLVHQVIRNGTDSAPWQADLQQTLKLNQLLQEKVSRGVLSADRQRGVELFLEQLRERLNEYRAGSYQHVEVLSALKRQLLGEEGISFTRFPPIEELPTAADLPPGLWRQRLEAMQAGDWLTDSQGQPLQLIWCSPTLDHFVLADTQGRECGSFSAREMLDQLANGSLLPVDEPPPDSGMLQRTLQEIVGRLFTEISQSHQLDELTGALSRSSFISLAAQALASSEVHAFIMLHVDMFALLNRRLGTRAGDACLRQLVEQWRAVLPESAKLARIAGVDFVMMLPGLSAQQALELAERLCRLVHSQGFDWERQKHPLSASIGVIQAVSGHDVTTVLSDLQTATHAARDAGRNRVHLLSPDKTHGEANLLAIAARIDSIIEKQQLSLRLQQIAPADPASPELPHYELLLVMENDLKLVDFISAAERYQRMPRVDRWVLKRVFAELELHPQVWQHSLSLSINLSGSSLNDDRLTGFIESLFEQHGIDPSKICFELTESSMVANLARTADMMRYLQGLGCSFSIDDFGVGFSSFDYLKRLPADYVKIDGSFVREIENSSGDLAMVRSINEIAHALGRKTVAEFVETPSIRQRLLEMGVDYVQGYGVERPKPLSAWLRQ
jgi:diguanylate cyclase (GGDEF)-like protein